MSMLSPLHEDWQSSMGPCDSFWHMFENQLLCDVVFQVGTDAEIIGAHSLILTSRSSVFFSEFIQEIPEQVITLTDVEPRVFRLFLKFLYTGETDIDNENEKGLEILAKKYNVHQLLRKLTTYQLSHMNAVAFCKFVKDNERQVRSYTKFACLRYVFDHSVEVFTSRTFSLLPRKFLKEIITNEYLVLEEKFVYDAVLIWATCACNNAENDANGENRRKVLGDILFDIRFPLLSREFFKDNVSETGLLSSEEELMVVMFFVYGENAMRPGFKFKYQSRICPGETFVYHEEHEASPRVCNAGANLEVPPSSGGACGSQLENPQIPPQEHIVTTNTKCYLPPLRQDEFIPRGPPSPNAPLIGQNTSSCPPLTGSILPPRDQPPSGQPTCTLPAGAMNLLGSGDASSSNISNIDGNENKSSSAEDASLFKNSNSSTLVADNSPSSSLLPSAAILPKIEKQENVVNEMSPPVVEDQVVSMVTRFPTIATGWRYKVKKKDAICFISSKDIHLESVLVYGCCESTDPICLKFQFMNDSSTFIFQFEKTINVEASVPTYDVKLEKEGKLCSLALMANKEYHILVTVTTERKGYHGTDGKVKVTAGGVDFLFKKSRYSTNNTNEESGQIPGFKFMVR